MTVARAVARPTRYVVEASWFSWIVLAVILGNATLIGLETYSGFFDRWHSELADVEYAFLAFFTLEIVLRLAAHADRPGEFFRDPWNLFDLVIIVAAVVPIGGNNSTVLRVLRLSRVLRTARFLPQVRIFITALGRSLPGTASFLVVSMLLMYLYAMVGWMLFAKYDPTHFGTIGRAGLTLFLLTSLDGLGDTVRAGLEISGWTILYYASFVLLGSFVLMNLLVGIVINALQEAHELEARALRRAQAAEEETSVSAAELARLRESLATARDALDILELELAVLAAQRERPAPTRERQPAS